VWIGRPLGHVQGSFFDQVAQQNPLELKVFRDFGQLFSDFKEKYFFENKGRPLKELVFLPWRPKEALQYATGINPATSRKVHERTGQFIWVDLVFDSRVEHLDKVHACDEVILCAVIFDPDASDLFASIQPRKRVLESQRQNGAWRTTPEIVVEHPRLRDTTSIFYRAHCITAFLVFIAQSP
jgi:hypothetical protein